MMDLSRFYVLIDTEKKIIIDKIEKLPENWNNISGLSGLSEEELENLDWSGNNNLGWMNILSNKLKNYKSSKENLELNKNEFKRIISQERKLKQTSKLFYKDIPFVCDQKTIMFLMLKRNISAHSTDIINYKLDNKYYGLTSDDIFKISVIIDRHIQKCFDWEKNIFDQIDDFKSVSEFNKINYDF